MATTRLRLREEGDDTNQAGVIDAGGIDTQRAVFQSDKIIGSTELKRNLGKLKKNVDYMISEVYFTSQTMQVT